MRSKPNAPKSTKFYKYSPSHVRRALPQIIAALCAFIFLVSGIYVIFWYTTRSRIQRESSLYQSMYLTNTDIAHASPTPDVASPTPSPTSQLSIDEPTSQLEGLQLSTPDADTLLLPLESPPPIQGSFSTLLSHNEDTIGFLQVGDIIALPVVQRENDNEYYLTHNFSQTKSSEGALFLDGMNRLVPEDDCLIIYGHNMNNGTMFGNLHGMLDLDALRTNPIVQFNTLYKDGSYIPFAGFNASMDPTSADYFDVRQFVFDETTFELFALKLKDRSEIAIPVDVRYGDDLLLLVTCDYTTNDGRLILALRRLREGETETEAIAWMGHAYWKDF